MWAQLHGAGRGKPVMSNQQTASLGDRFSNSVAPRRRFGLALLALVALYPATPMAQTSPAGPMPQPSPAAPMPQPTPPPRVVALPPPAQQFFAAVRTNFAAWNLAHDGQLTRAEIEIDLQDARITGEAAAALAALKLAATHYNHLPDTRTYTLADIDALEQKLQAGEKLDANFVGYFTTGLKKQREVPRQLFSEGIPRLTAIRQDWTTDCYFLSTVGALAQVNPQAIVRLITPAGNGMYTVSFPGKPPVRVPAPTDAELATYSNARDGLWLSLLEKAYAIVRIKAEPTQASTMEPLDSVGFRTGSSRVVELLTGHQSKTIELPAGSHRPADEHLRQELRSQLQAAFREHLAVTLGNSHHDYAIVAYEPSSDLVTIHNPYDRGGAETYPDGVKVSYSDEGFFTLSVTQLVNYFNYLCFELGSRVS
jgi:Calpain family cysteine protease